jgi:alkaline phosphatase D
VRALAALGLVAVGLAVPAAAGGRHAAIDGFAEGVAAGEIRSGSALLWTRAPAVGPVRLELARGASFAGATVRRARATGAADRTVTVAVAGLQPGTRYRYRFRQGALVSPSGTFRTAPGADAGATVRFAISGDADATPGANGEPAFNDFETYGRMAAERNDFNVNLGDTIYSDSGVGGAPVARTVAAKRAKYRLGLALEPLRRLRAAAGLYSHWDDHEFLNDFSRAEHGNALYRAGVRAFRDYAPVAYTSRTGLYRHVRWGRNLELFFLDERSFRSAKATAPCNGDLAPTVPAALRAGFATLAPSLAQPPPPACLQALASPSRTMLGAAQLARFERDLRASTATFKVIVNEVPLQELYVLPYDRWEGYAAERTRLLALLQEVGNAVVLTTDSHAHMVGELRTGTLSPAPASTGIWEVVTGPVATNTYGREIDRYLGARGTAGFVTALFFKPPPPRGLGLECVNVDQYGYAQVVVTSRALTVTPRTAAGGRVVDASGRPCAPLVLRAR